MLVKLVYSVDSGRKTIRCWNFSYQYGYPNFILHTTLWSKKGLLKSVLFPWSSQMIGNLSPEKRQQNKEVKFTHAIWRFRTRLAKFYRLGEYAAPCTTQLYPWLVWWPRAAKPHLTAWMAGRALESAKLWARSNSTPCQCCIVGIWPCVFTF